MHNKSGLEQEIRNVVLIIYQKPRKKHLKLTWTQAENQRSYSVLLQAGLVQL